MVRLPQTKTAHKRGLTLGRYVHYGGYQNVMPQETKPEGPRCVGRKNMCTKIGVLAQGDIESSVQYSSRWQRWYHAQVDAVESDHNYGREMGKSKFQERLDQYSLVFFERSNDSNSYRLFGSQLSVANGPSSNQLRCSAPGLSPRVSAFF